MAHILPSEQVAVVGVINPDANTATTYYTDYVNMEFFQQAMGLVQVGIIAAGGTVDAGLVQATSSTGADVKAVSTSHQITQITTAGNDTQALINVTADDLDVAGGFSFVALRMTVATAAADSAGTLLGVNPRFGPASANDLASVAEIAP